MPERSNVERPGVTTAQAALPKAILRETLGVIADVIVPTLAKGVIIRHPKMVVLAEWLGLDRRAVRRMQRLRNKYGDGPLLLRIRYGSRRCSCPWSTCIGCSKAPPEPFATATTRSEGHSG